MTVRGEKRARTLSPQRLPHTLLSRRRPPAARRLRKCEPPSRCAGSQYHVRRSDAVHRAGTGGAGARSCHRRGRCRVLRGVGDQLFNQARVPDAPGRPPGLARRTAQRATADGRRLIPVVLKARHSHMLPVDPFARKRRRAELDHPFNRQPRKASSSKRSRTRRSP